VVVIFFYFCPENAENWGMRLEIEKRKMRGREKELEKRLRIVA